MPNIPLLAFPTCDGGVTRQTETLRRKILDHFIITGDSEYVQTWTAFFNAIQPYDDDVNSYYNAAFCRPFYFTAPFESILKDRSMFIVRNSNAKTIPVVGIAESLPDEFNLLLSLAMPAIRSDFDTDTSRTCKQRIYSPNSPLLRGKLELFNCSAERGLYWQRLLSFSVDDLKRILHCISTRLDGTEMYLRTGPRPALVKQIVDNTAKILTSLYSAVLPEV